MSIITTQKVYSCCNISIEVSLKNECVYLNDKDTLCFNIHNKDNDAVWVNTAGLLMFLEIRSNDGDLINPYIKNEESPVFNENFILVSGNSSKTICVSTKLFERYLFQKEKQYALHLKYGNVIKKKGTKLKTLNGTLDIPKIMFNICR